MAKKHKQVDIPAAKFTGETLGVVGLVCLAVGFFLGVVFTVYRTASDTPSAPTARPPHGVQDRAPEMADRIAKLEQQAAANPKDPGIWAELGHHYFDTGKTAKAVEAYRKSLSLDSDNADVWTDLGVMYRREGKPKQAIEAFDRAGAIDPVHEVSLFNKGIVLLHDLKDTAGAIAAWEKLVGINPLAMAPNGQSVDALLQHYKEHPDAGSK
jgi:cytochrome c-type biogenesis protein CcmH/NrfG